MKKTIPYLLCLLFCAIVCIAGAQQVKNVRPGVVGSWRELGTTVVNFTVDHDGIIVAGADAFRRLKFHVFDAPVEMIRMNVVYENGAPDNIPLSFVIPAGGESRVIDLRGTERRLRRIDFWYKTGRPGFRGRAKVVLWGIK